jgi:hypothetical protein
MDLKKENDPNLPDFIYIDVCVCVCVCVCDSLDFYRKLEK